MEDMAKHPRLHMVGNTYYFRAAIPSDIKDIYPTSVVKFSLKTKNYQEAVKLLRIESARVDKDFEVYRRKQKAASAPAQNSIPQSLIDQIATRHKHWQIESDETIRSRGFYSDGVSFETYVKANENFNKVDTANYAQGIVPDVYFEMAEELLAEQGVRLKKSSDSLRKLARELMAVSIESHAVVDKRNQGEVIRTPLAPDFSSVKNSTYPLLSEAIVRYCEQMADNGNASGTLEDKRETVKLFIEIIGDKSIDGYVKADVRGFKDVFQWFPANKNKKKIFEGMSAREVSKYVKDNHLEPMSNTTRRKYMTNLQTVWNWFADEYDEEFKNPFKGMNWKKDSGSSKTIVPFTSDELKKLFNAPIYKGCKSESEWKREGNVVLKGSAKYWIPLLALYTGARLEEICQLHTSNIKFEHGVNFIEITDQGADQKLKKHKDSRKDVPIHSDLISLGFLDFVESRRVKKDERLFPDLIINSEGKYGANFSKHASRFLKACGVKHDYNNFYSFRHTFIDACRNAGVPSDMWHRLTGHKLHSIGERYGRGYMLPKLNQEVQKIDYGLFAESEN